MGPGFRVSKSPPSLLFSWRKKKEYTKENHDVGTIGDLFFWKEMFRDRERLKAEMGGGRKRKGEEENRYLLEWSERARERERGWSARKGSGPAAEIG